MNNLSLETDHAGIWLCEWEGTGFVQLGHVSWKEIAKFLNELEEEEEDE